SRRKQFLEHLRRPIFALALTSSPMVAESRLILISPHNEAIRYEFGRGIDEWHRKRFGEGAAVEWRDAGGTADALRFVQSEFVAKPDGIGIDIFFGGDSEAFLQACGWDRGWQLLTEIAGKPRKFDRFSSTTAKDVTLGETAYAFAIDFYAFTQIAVAGRSNITFALPQDFTAISPDGIAILKGAPNRAVAQRFIDLVLGEEGQQLWFLQRCTPDRPQN